MFLQRAKFQVILPHDVCDMLQTCLSNHVIPNAFWPLGVEADCLTFPASMKVEIMNLQSYCTMLLLLALIVCSGVHANAQRTQAVASPVQIQARLKPQPLLSEFCISTFGVRKQGPAVGSANKTSTVAAVPLGTASNIISIRRAMANQIVAIDSLDFIAFVHRNNTGIFGGDNGTLRYDFSLDGGYSFYNDIGLLNPLVQRAARFPNIAGLSLPGNQVPLATRLVYAGPTLNLGNSSWDGHVHGLSSMVTGGIPATTEHYAFQGQTTFIPGSLCQSAPGIYWMSEIGISNFDYTGAINIYRGQYIDSLNDVVWEYNDSMAANNYTGFDGAPWFQGPSIAFSPDGQVGWVAWVGDLVGGPDSTWLPILAQTTDCGATWNEPIEVNLNAIAWIKDSLQTLWTDSLGFPLSNGRANCGFDFDLTVDAQGNPHFGVVIASGINYELWSGLSKFLVDVTTTDGGNHWQAQYLSPVLTMRTPDFGVAPAIITMDNFVQVARDEGGCNIFFSWADSDTALVTGNQNGVGFGESQNLAPNLRIVARNIYSGMQTYPRLISDTDVIWDGHALFPTMAPQVITDANGWKLPIVAAAMTTQDPLDPVAFWYLGNDARIPNQGWCDPASMQLSWPSFGYNGFQSPCTSGVVAACNVSPTSPCIPLGTAQPQRSLFSLGLPYPNPMDQVGEVSFELQADAHVRLGLSNAMGQEVLLLKDQDFGAGIHTVGISVAHLPSGLYLCTLQTAFGDLHRPLIVAH